MKKKTSAKTTTKKAAKESTKAQHEKAINKAGVQRLTEFSTPPVPAETQAAACHLAEDEEGRRQASDQTIDDF